MKKTSLILNILCFLVSFIFIFNGIRVCFHLLALILSFGFICLTAVSDEGIE